VTRHHFLDHLEDSLTQKHSSTSLAAAMTAPCWLGVDLSTQSVTVALLPDEKGAAPLAVLSVVFERDLPQYNTTNGMHIQDGDHPGDVSSI
jgi:Ethanolamine utilization protein EutJ (predicted chaperonin)